MVKIETVKGEKSEKIRKNLKEIVNVCTFASI